MQSEEEKNRLRVLSQQNNTPIRISQPQVSLPQINISQPQPATSITTPQIRVSTPTVSSPNVEAIKQIPIPGYSSFGAKLKDIFIDANTPQDIAKRQNKGLPASYSEQKIQEGERPITNPLGQIAAGPLRTINLFSAGAQQIPGLVKIGAAAVTGNKPAMYKAAAELEKTQQRVLAPNAGILGIGTAIPSKEWLDQSSFADRMKLAAAYGAENAAWVIGGKGLPILKGVSGANKVLNLAKFVSLESFGGALGGGGGTVVRKPEASGKEILANAAVGAAITPLFAGAAGLATRGIAEGISYALDRPAGKRLISALSKETDQTVIKDSVKELIPNLTEEQYNLVAKQISEMTAKEEVVAILREAATVSNNQLYTKQAAQQAAESAAVKKLTEDLAQATNVDIIKQTVKNILPQLDERGQTQLSQEIARANTPEAVSQALDKAEAASKQLTQNIQQLTPPVTSPAQQTAEALTQAIQQPSTAPTVVSNQPTTIQPPTQEIPVTQPAGVSGAGGDGNVPGAGDVGDIPNRLVAEAEAQQQRYKPSGIIQTLKEIWDPRASALKIDRKYAKEIADVKIGNLNAIDRLEFYLIQSQNYNNQALEYLANSNIAKVIQKYKPNTAQGNAFNTYRIFMRDLEAMADGKAPIVRDISEQDKLAFVQQFESANPTARQDLLNMVKDIEALQDLTVQGKDAFLSPEELQAARTKKDGTRYQYFTPISRAAPDNVERPMVNSRNIGTLGQQRVLREYTGSGLPVDPTYNPITDYVTTVFKQLGQSRVIKKFAERVEQGVVPGAEFIQTPEDFIRIEKLKANYNELKDISVSLTKEIRKLVTQAKVAREQIRTEAAKLKAADVRAELNLKAANKVTRDKISAAVVRAKELLVQSLDKTDTDAISAVNSLSDEEFINLLDYMTRGELFYTPPSGRAKFKAVKSAEAKAATAAETTKLQQAAIDRIARKGDNFARLVDQVGNLRLDLEMINNAKKGIRQELIDLREDPITGLQTVVGRDANGVPFRIEVAPEYARLLQGIGQENINALLRISTLIQKPIRAALTGPLNPAFQLAQATWNAILTPLLSKDGLRVYSPAAVKQAFKSFNSNDKFQQILRANGAPAFSGSYNKLPVDTTSEALAAQADKLSKFKWYANPKRMWSKLEELGGKLDNAVRTAAAEAAYQRVIKQGGTKEEALAEAIFARTQVQPDYSNLHSLIRAIDASPITMYAGAGQAGTRTFFRAIKERPGQTLGKLGALAAVAAAVAAYSLGQDKGEEFYKDMIDSKKEYILDNNFIIVLPGAKKDETTGEWTGIIKYGLPNELRPLNRAIRSTVYSGQPGVPVRIYAKSLFDFFTGGLVGNANPIIKIGTAIQTGKDMQTGREIYDQTMDNNQKRDAILKYTKQQFGVPGKVIATDKPAEAFINSFVDRVYGAKGSTEASRYYMNQDKAIKKVGLNKNELDAYQGSVAPASKDLTGNEIKDKTYYDSASKAITYLRYPKTFEVSKEVDRLAREQGKPGDPLFDLPADKLKVILNMQANFSPGNYEDQATLKLNPWITDFNKSRSEYFNKVISDEKKKASGVDPMGIAIPQATPELSSKLNKLKTLTNAEKSQFYSENPDVTEFFAAQDNYERVKRGFLGLPQFDAYPTPTKEVQGFIDEFSKLDKPNRSAWIKANQNKWNAMTQQWTLQDVYRLQKEGALGVYEGLDFTEQGIKSILDIAKAMGFSQGGGFGFGASKSQAYLQAMAALRSVNPSIQPLEIISAKPQQVRLKRVSVPTSRRTARIRLR